ncbi:MAG: hemerythrin domain-containing protein [Actinomycetales bacterium]|nr:hemerythrin domain-containing protein [Actinomycetales bacterium]
MCSYCGCRANTLIARYSADHVDIVNALGDLRRAVQGTSPESVPDAAARMAALLDPHTVSEERSLFAELRVDPEFTDHVDGLCAEHAELDGLLARIAAGQVADLPAFELQLRRHIDKEENGLFPAAIIALDGAAWERAVAAA